MSSFGMEAITISLKPSPSTSPAAGDPVHDPMNRSPPAIRPSGLNAVIVTPRRPRCRASNRSDVVTIGGSGTGAVDAAIPAVRSIGTHDVIPPPASPR